ncbi:Protein FAM53A [Dissostichus eleginoides]|uniref:Protein FAM53A n=1 Tax=Dissostichus eleginoides TaxID=100907 RepID=A0AAD9B1S0_DISEL|nr:Protein FAM53A [Dissostichus eleginoides]
MPESSYWQLCPPSSKSGLQGGLLSSSFPPGPDAHLQEGVSRLDPPLWLLPLLLWPLPLRPPLPLKGTVAPSQYLRIYLAVDTPGDRAPRGSGPPSAGPPAMGAGLGAGLIHQGEEPLLWRYLRTARCHGASRGTPVKRRQGAEPVAASSRHPATPPQCDSGRGRGSNGRLPLLGMQHPLLPEALPAPPLPRCHSQPCDLLLLKPGLKRRRDPERPPARPLLDFTKMTQTRSMDPQALDRCGGRLLCGVDLSAGMESFLGDFRRSCSPAECLGRNSIGPLSESDEEECREDEEEEEEDDGDEEEEAAAAAQQQNVFERDCTELDLNLIEEN